MSSDTLDPQRVIDSSEQLAALVAMIGHPAMLAIDTEFHSERRYRPELLLVQLAVRGGPVWAIDPLAVDMTLLRPMLEGATWLVHGGSWDIRLLHSATGARPSSLVDTQLLAAFAGLPYPARLSILAHRVIGHKVDKAATLSNWGQRPLSAAQLEYARADVEVLFPLADRLLERVDALDAQAPARHGRAWGTAAGMELIEDALSPSDPHAQWRRLDIAPDFDGATRRALHALYAWRETEAQKRNSPAHFVLSPSIALDLARRRPTSIAGLRANRRFPQGLLKRQGAVLVQLLEAASRAPETPSPVVHAPAGRVAMLHVLRAVLAARSNIAPKLMFPDSTIKQVAQDGVERLRGWRKQAIATEVQDLMAGRTRLRVHEDRVVVEPIRQIGHSSTN